MRDQKLNTKKKFFLITTPTQQIMREADVFEYVDLGEVVNVAFVVELSQRLHHPAEGVLKVLLVVQSTP